MNVDYLSDIHINNWVSCRLPEYVQMKKIEEFVLKFIPKKRSKILIIPGDIGHSNFQNKILLEILKKFYDLILWNEGNHDIYLYELGDVEIFEHDSFKRLQDMIEISSKIDGVVYLNGVIEIDGKKIGGFPMWYDSVYANEVCGRSPIYVNQIWRMMPCSKYIFTDGFQNPRFDWQGYSLKQKENLNSFYKDCDLIFSHVSPDWSQIKDWHKGNPMSTFFHFDGRDFLKNCNNKTWVFGHTHDHYDYITESGCHMISNPLGYPGRIGSPEERNFESFSIKTLTI